MTVMRQRIFAVLYGSGILVDWGYYVATVPRDDILILFGWIPALFWPVHLLAEIWQLVL